MNRFKKINIWIGSIVVLGFICSISPVSFAEEYPSHPVTVIVPFGPGGGVDINTRALAPYLEKVLGEKTIVANRGGGGGITGHTLGAMAKPDGYTLTMVSTGICSGPWLIKDVRFSPESYEYIGQVSFIPNFLVVNAESPWKNLKEFVDYAKANPDKLSIPYMDGWTSSDIADAIFTHLAGIKTKVVGGFKSGAADIASVLGGHTSYSFNNTSEVMPHAAAGTIRILAVAAPKRSSFFPDVPTLKELGYDDSVGVFRTLAAPKGTPQPILDKLSKALKAALEQPGVPEDFKKVGLTVDYLGPQDARNFIMVQYEQFGKVFKSMGIAIK
jgi:tripartite-type tricarboxylate transporter receptor subunit TctC